MRTAVTPKLVLMCMFALAIAAAQPAAAQGLFSKDLTLHESTTGGMGGGANTTTTIYFSGNAMKRSSSDGNDTIIRFDSGKLITIDNKKKTYTEMSMEELQAMMDKASAAMGQMDGEAAAAMRKMMGGGQGPMNFTVTKIGPGEQIAGYATEKYQVKGGPMDMQIWAAPDVKVPAAYYDAMKARMRPNPMFDMAKMYEEFKKINGMAVKTISTMKMMGREMVTTTVVNSVEKGAVPGSTFDIPAGYRKIAAKE